MDSSLLALALILIVICNVDYGMGTFFKPHHLKDLLANDRERLQYIKTIAQRGGAMGVVPTPSSRSTSYFAKVAVGSPPRLYTMAIDTSSDTTWLKCMECVSCYNDTFDPTVSSSYREIKTSGGTHFTEEVSGIPNVSVSCIQPDDDFLSSSHAVLGLGHGPLSFASQTGGLFSYCLAIGNKASTLAFGHHVTIPPNTAFVPLLNSPLPFYSVDMIGINVAGFPVEDASASLFQINKGVRGGGAILDSRTAITWLPRSTYVAVRDAFRAQMKLLPLAATSNDALDTCYDISKASEGSSRKWELPNWKWPTIEFDIRGRIHFNISFPMANSLLMIEDNEEKIACLAMAPNEDDFSIIGSIQQQGSQIVFDTPNSRIGFARDQC